MDLYDDIRDGKVIEGHDKGFFIVFLPFGKQCI